MKLLTFAIIICIMLSSCSRVYIIKIEPFVGFDGEPPSYLMQYGIDGHTYFAQFDTQEELMAYKAWLEKGRRVDNDAR